jgi:hypothetical protein
MAIRQCPQCGAAVDAADATLATTCAFCDSPLVDGSEGSAPVDFVVPFTLDRARAAALLKGHLQGQWLAPEAIRHAARAEGIDAVLVPFYAFDAICRTMWSTDVGIEWQRTETYTTTGPNGETRTETRTVTETEWFPLGGTHVRHWKGNLVSASKGLPEQEANQLEPFDLGRARPFSASLTAGVLAEHPTIPHETATDVARNELAALEKHAIASELLPGDKHRNLDTTSQIDVQGTKLYLLPVWIAAYKTDQGVFRLLVNGQTGEVVGKVPRSKMKVLALVLTLLVALVLVLGVCLFGGAVVSCLGGGG